MYQRFTIWTTHEGGVLHSTWVPGEACFHLNEIVAKQILVLDCRTSSSFNLYPTNAPDRFKSASYECTKSVRCGHLNAPYSHVQA
jgi:hypothetical protein